MIKASRAQGEGRRGEGQTSEPLLSEAVRASLQTGDDAITAGSLQRKALPRAIAKGERTLSIYVLLAGSTLPQSTHTTMWKTSQQQRQTETESYTMGVLDGRLGKGG